MDDRVSSGSAAADEVMDGVDLVSILTSDLEQRGDKEKMTQSCSVHLIFLQSYLIFLDLGNIRTHGGWITENGSHLEEKNGD